MIIEWLFAGLVIYLLYKLIFDFILPVSRASSQLRNKMNEMHQQQRQQPSNNNKTEEPTTVRPPAEDYIDFEEIK